MPKSIYPKLSIRSKNELAKHISHKDFSFQNALDLINDCLLNFDHYWKDSNKSEPEKNKYVRNASGKNLKKLHRKINSRILAPHDKRVPHFIFGGLKERNHAMAAKELLGVKRKRVLLKMDLRRFFEQVKSERVESFFRMMCDCKSPASKILANLCCVPRGRKGSGDPIITIARGFATSPRLAVWCNLNVFLKLRRLILRRLKGYDPKIAVYVDDIGITASRIPKEAMVKLELEIKELLATADPNQPLEVNEEKTEIRSHDEGIHYLGLDLHRNRLVVGGRARAKKEKVKSLLKVNPSPAEKINLLSQKRAMNRYKSYIDTL